MALLIKRSLELYHYTKHDLADPRTNDWFLVKSPITVIFIQCIYLLLVYELIPKFMENRKPYNLRRTLLVYDFVQILASSYIVIMGFPATIKIIPWCAPVDYSNNPESVNLANLTWFYFMLKVTDLLDTIFFVLRKKNSQVTFLHTYHHAGMLVIGWVGIKYVPGGESVYVGMVNSFVHVIMYTYYMYSTLFVENRERILWWKKHVTQIQLIQFGIFGLVYTSKLFISCPFPKMLLLIVSIQNLVMIFMFGDFYYKTYIKNSKSPAHQKVNGSQ